ncbi:MAG: cyclic-di-AMP receptor [Oscillospiraceae bacterium]|nr:cyclic-di-AMP receptor [Oscillospiraceae bacterium]
MKMILAVIDKDDTHAVMQHLVKEGFSITTLSTTGGFLKAGNTTILVGVDDEKTQDVIAIIKEHSKSRTRQIPLMPSSEMGSISTMPVEVLVGGATIFVMNVEHFEKM